MFCEPRGDGVGVVEFGAALTPSTRCHIKQDAAKDLLRLHLCLERLEREKALRGVVGAAADVACVDIDE